MTNDPLEGFHITDYDPATEMVTIQLHKSLRQDQRQLEAITRKAKEIIEAGPSVNSVKFEPREEAPS